MRSDKEKLNDFFASKRGQAIAIEEIPAALPTGDILRIDAEVEAFAEKVRQMAIEEGIAIVFGAGKPVTEAKGFAPMATRIVGSGDEYAVGALMKHVWQELGEFRDQAAKEIRKESKSVSPGRNLNLDFDPETASEETRQASAFCFRMMTAALKVARDMGCVALVAVGRATKVNADGSDHMVMAFGRHGPPDAIRGVIEGFGQAGVEGIATYDEIEAEFKKSSPQDDSFFMSGTVGNA